ncbi:MAG TPA: hypothetical protein VNQ99_16515 [Xanthobacteraceae bacterium]|nr:hypothetical protein [Xanthobacteraceae bacterium]
MGELYATETPLQVLFITVILGGGAAALAGRAIARTWRPTWHLVTYMALLGAAVRFIHFALFEGELLSLPSYLMDTAVLIAISALAWRIARTTQMVTQYHWLFERASPLTWRARDDAMADPKLQRDIARMN